MDWWGGVGGDKGVDIVVSGKIHINRKSNFFAVSFQLEKMLLVVWRDGGEKLRVS